MNIKIIALISLLFLTPIFCFAQYDAVSEIQINDVQLRITKEEDVLSKLGVPTEIKEEVNYAGNDEFIKVYCYGDSYFEFWDGLLQSFLIKDASYSFNNSFKVGNSVDIFRVHFPLSFEKPLSTDQISEFDKINFVFDTCYWLDASGGDGVLVFINKGAILGYRYAISS